MLNILLDTLVLAILIKALGDEEPGIGSAYWLAVGSAVGACITGFLFVPYLGIFGYVAAGIFGAVFLACTLHLFAGVEIRRALAIGAIFIVLHAGIGFGLWALIGDRRRLVIPLGPLPRREEDPEKMELSPEEYRSLAPELRPLFKERQEEPPAP